MVTKKFSTYAEATKWADEHDGSESDADAPEFRFESETGLWVATVKVAREA